MPEIPRGVRRALNLPTSTDRLARDLDDEVRFHMEMRIAELERRGMSPEDASDMIASVIRLLGIAKRFEGGYAATSKAANRDEVPCRT